MNNKGQVLVTFVLVLPIIFVVFALIIDYGIISVEKRKASNNIKSSIEYGLRHIDENNVEDEIRNLIYQNIDKDNIKKLDLEINNHYIAITLNLKYTSLFGIFSKNKEFIISYSGTIDNNEIKVIKR